MRVTGELNVRRSSPCLLFFYSLQEQHNQNEENMLSALKTLQSFSQRVSFASGRVQMLQGRLYWKAVTVSRQIPVSCSPLFNIVSSPKYWGGLS